MATDIVGGLRILRGIGGEETFGGNYAAPVPARAPVGRRGRAVARRRRVRRRAALGRFRRRPDVARHARGRPGPPHRGAARQLPRLRPLPHPADAHLRRVRPEVDPLGRLGAQGGRRLLAEPAVGPPRRAGHARHRRRDRRRRVRGEHPPGHPDDGRLGGARRLRPPSPTVSAATCPARRGRSSATRSPRTSRAGPRDASGPPGPAPARSRPAATRSAPAGRGASPSAGSTCPASSSRTYAVTSSSATPHPRCSPGRCARPSTRSAG